MCSSKGDAHHCSGKEPKRGVVYRYMEKRISSYRAIMSVSMLVLHALWECPCYRRSFYASCRIFRGDSSNFVIVVVSLIKAQNGTWHHQVVVMIHQSSLCIMLQTTIIMIMIFSVHFFSFLLSFPGLPESPEHQYTLSPGEISRDPHTKHLKTQREWLTMPSKSLAISNSLEA